MPLRASGATILWYRPRFAGLTRTHPGSFQQLGEPSVGESFLRSGTPGSRTSPGPRTRSERSRSRTASTGTPPGRARRSARPAPAGAAPRPPTRGGVPSAARAPSRSPEEAPPVLVARLRRELERRQARLVEDLVGEPVSDPAIARWSVRRVLSWREAASSAEKRGLGQLSARRVWSDRPRSGSASGSSVSQRRARFSVPCSIRSSAGRRRRRCARRSLGAGGAPTPARLGAGASRRRPRRIRCRTIARRDSHSRTMYFPRRTGRLRYSPANDPEERPSGAAQAGAPRSLRFAAPRPRRQVLGQDLEERASGTATRGARPRSACSGTDARATSSRARRTAPAPATP